MNFDRVKGLRLFGIGVAMIAIVAVGPSSVTVLLVIGLVFVPVVARTVRAAVLSERNCHYNILGTIVVEATVRLGYAIFVAATLSFLGMGVQPPTPDWGLSIYESYGLISAGFWWPVAFPALAIASLVVSINIIAEKTLVNGR